MSEKLEDLLATKESELFSLCSIMQKIKLQFINDISDFAAKWYEETARQYIKKYSEVSLNLSTESFGDLKKKVKRLVAGSKEISEKVLGQSGIWWHERPELHSAVSQYDQLGDQQVGNKYPEVIDRPVRIVLGELGIILEEFGFSVRTGVTYGPHNEEYWFEKTEDKTTSPYFPHMLEWSKQMQETLSEYNQLYKQAMLVLQAIQTIKDEIKKRKIIDLWDSTS
jgi:hypothetical protein